MKIRSFKLRKVWLRWRRIAHRRGHGVHSPFVYNLITKVIEERCGYYCYNDIELIRKQLLQKSEKIIYINRKTGKPVEKSVSYITKREAIPPKQGKLLFRLANYLKPKTILQVGASMGISTLYLSAFSRDADCVVMEKDTMPKPYLRWALNKRQGNDITLLTGAYTDQLPIALEQLKSIDFVFFNLSDKQSITVDLLKKCIEYVNNHTVFVFNAIRTNKEMLQCWKEVRELPEISVTLDLGSMGIAFFNPQLHKRHYKVWF